MKHRAIAIAVALAAWPGVAGADAIPTSAPETPAMGVWERAQAQTGPKGLDLGGLRLYPALDLAAAGDGNIYRSNAGAVGDAYFTVAPSLDLRSDWNNHLVEVTAAVSHYRYDRHASEDRTDWRVGAHGRLDILRGTTAEGEVDYVASHEPRFSPDEPGNAAAPTRFTNLHAETQFTRDAGQLGFSLAARFDRLDYDATPLLGGGMLSNDDRDQKKLALEGRAWLEVADGAALFLRGRYDVRSFDLGLDRGGFNRNSHGYALDGGAMLRLSDLLQGEAWLGYARQRFHGPLPDVGGLDFGARLTWYPDALYTVHLTAQRRFTDTTLFGASVSDDRVVRLAVDYELLRDLILTAGASYTDSRFAGAARTDTIWGADLRADYLINRYLRASLSYGFSHRASSWAGQDFRDHTVGVGLKFSL